MHGIATFSSNFLQRLTISHDSSMFMHRLLTLCPYDMWYAQPVQYLTNILYSCLCLLFHLGKKSQKSKFLAKNLSLLLFLSMCIPSSSARYCISCLLIVRARVWSEQFYRLYKFAAQHRTSGHNQNLLAVLAYNIFLANQHLLKKGLLDERIKRRIFNVCTNPLFNGGHR